MATALTKPVRRLVVMRDGTELIVTLTHAGIFTRLKGKCIEYGPYPYSSLHLRSVEITVGLAVTAPPRKRRRVVRGAL